MRLDLTLASRAANSRLRSCSAKSSLCSPGRGQKLAPQRTGTVNQQASNILIQAALIRPARTSQSRAAITYSLAVVAASLPALISCDCPAGNSLPYKSQIIFHRARNVCNSLTLLASFLRSGRKAIFWGLRKPMGFAKADMRRMIGDRRQILRA